MDCIYQILALNVFHFLPGENLQTKLRANKILSGNKLHQFEAEVQCFRDILCLHHQGML